MFTLNDPRRPVRRLLALSGTAVLLLQLVAAAPAACASMHAGETGSPVSEMAHAQPLPAATPPHSGSGVTMAATSADHEHRSPVSCAMMNHCTSWVPRFDPTPIGKLSVQTVAGLYGEPWQLHPAVPSGIVPPPKI